MHPSLGHGPRLSDEEYDRRIVALHSELPPIPSRSERARVRREELKLAVAHRLGTHFPEDRLAALWEVQQRLERRRLRLVLWAALRSLGRGILTRKAQGIASELVQEFGTILSPRELEAFFGAEEVRSPGLPDERDHGDATN